ncbi:hypothetical protein HDU93_005365, partial [Gonapodya sp. JEL0774]
MATSWSVPAFIEGPANLCRTRAPELVDSSHMETEIRCGDENTNIASEESCGQTTGKLNESGARVDVEGGADEDDVESVNYPTAKESWNFFRAPADADGSLVAAGDPDGESVHCRRKVEERTNDESW